MALQTSGAISLNDIHVEAGDPSGTSVSINNANVRDLIGKASQTQMSFNEWYGASASYLDTSSTAPYGAKPYENGSSQNSQTINLSTRQASLWQSNGSGGQTAHFYWDADTSLINATVDVTFDVDFFGNDRYYTHFLIYFGLCNNTQNAGLQSVSSSSSGSRTLTDIGLTDQTNGCVKKILEFRRNPAQDWYDTYDASGNYVRTSIGSSFSGTALTGRTFTHTFTGSSGQCRPWLAVYSKGMSQPGSFSQGTNSFDMVIS